MYATFVCKTKHLLAKLLTMDGLFIQDVETQKFKVDYDLLWRGGAFKKQADVSRAISYDRSSFNQVLNGKRNLPPDKIKLFYEKYNSKHLLANKLTVNESQENNYVTKTEFNELKNKLDFLQKKFDEAIWNLAFTKRGRQKKMGNA